MKYVTEADLSIINKTLESGQDVRIQLTKSGCRIVADKVTVLKKSETAPQKMMGFSDRRN